MRIQQRQPAVFSRILGRQRFLMRWIALLVCLSGVFWMPSSPVRKLLAQDEQTAAEPADETNAGGEDTSGSVTEEAPLEEPVPTKTALDTLMDGGVVGLLILVLSFAAVGMIVEHSLTIRKDKIMPEMIMQELEQLIQQGQIDHAIATCAEPANECLASSVVLAGLERFRGSEFGFAEYKAAVEEAGEDQTAKLYRKTEILGVIGAIAPMMGLSGTVLGMIKAFNKIAETQGAADPAALAGPIGQALVTTLLGLFVAIPTMVAYSFFRNRVDSLVSEAGNRIERIMMPLSRRQ